MKVYKVVSNWDAETSSGKSAIVRRGVYCMDYKIGKKTKAYRETPGLFVFKTLDDSLSFMACNLGIIAPALLLCEAPVKGRRGTKSIEAMIEWVPMLMTLQERAKICRHDTDVSHVPCGTLSVKELVPLEIVRVG